MHEGLYENIKNYALYRYDKFRKQIGQHLAKLQAKV